MYKQSNYSMSILWDKKTDFFENLAANHTCSKYKRNKYLRANKASV